MPADDRSAVRSIRLANFRRFEDTGTIQLAPITLVLGKNSSGKTSLLRSLLLVKQLVAEPSFEDVPLGGPLVDLGSYKELVYGGEVSRDVRISVSLGFDEPRFVHRELEESELSELSTGAIVHMTLHWNKMQQRAQFTEIEFASLREGGKSILRCVRRGPNSFRLEHPSGRTIIPNALSFGALSRLSIDTRRESAPRGRRRVRQDYLFLFLMDAIRTAISSVDYVRPLRDVPDRAYRIDQLSPESATASVVNLLERQRRAQVTLSEALDEMGMARDVSLARIAPGYVGIVLTDRQTGRTDNLTDVGFGVSQVLPVIAAVATADSSATVLIEQPELHLHPEAQGRLTDVLVKLARSQAASLVIETHSEHMLLRVMRRVAEKSLEPDSIRVIVVDDGRVSTLGIDNLGRLSGGGLPSGFFEEDWEDTMLLAKAAATQAGES